MWLLTSQKNGVSAVALQRVLGWGSYQTAWTCLHKLRRAMVRPGRERLAGVVEVDESYLGGDEQGVDGRHIAGKALVVAAVEEDGRGIGRIRLRHIPDASAARLIPFIEDSIEPGSTVHTDGWSGYVPLRKAAYQHRISNQKGHSERAVELLPRVHQVFSLLKRWLLGTHRDQSPGNIFRITSTNSRSASTAANRAAEANSFTAWCNRPSQSNQPLTDRLWTRP